MGKPIKNALGQKFLCDQCGHIFLDDEDHYDIEMHKRFGLNSLDFIGYKHYCKVCAKPYLKIFEGTASFSEA